MSNQYNQDGTTYWVYNDNPKLPVIIMIHGFRGTHHGLELIAKNLDGYKIIIPDLPGFGVSEPMLCEHSVENYVSWLKNFISKLKPTTPPILLGHSFGSIIASNYASKYPQYISKLILVNPIGAPALKGPKVIMTKFAQLYYLIGNKLPDSSAKKWLSSNFVVMAMSITMAKTRDKKTRKFIHSEHLAHFNDFSNRQVVTEAFKASIQNDVSEVASKIIIPTLLIVGNQDDITPLKKQLKLAQMFKTAKIEVIKNVGHLTHYETPVDVANMIKNFTR